MALTSLKFDIAPNLGPLRQNSIKVDEGSNTVSRKTLLKTLLHCAGMLAVTNIAFASVTERAETTTSSRDSTDFLLKVLLEKVRPLALEHSAEHS